MDPQSFQAQIERMLEQENGDTTGIAVEDKPRPSRTSCHGPPTTSWDEQTPSRAEFMDPQTLLSQMKKGSPSFQQWPVSEQIYVMGSDLLGRYIAFKLAGVQTLPPVRYLIHRMNLWRSWEDQGRQLTLHTAHETVRHDRVQAEYMSMKSTTPIDGPHIDNIIVTVPPGLVVSALAPIKHRLDHMSTICLIHDGLGAAEAIIEAHFPDKFSRPVFVLGHMTAKLAHPPLGERYSVVELKPGRLYLSLFGTMPAVTNLRIHTRPPMERTTRFKHFLRLMVTMPGFHATSHPFADFLRTKLPKIILLSIADPLAAMLNVPYVQLGKNRYSKRLVLEMLWEVCSVIAKLPEYRSKRGIRWLEQQNTLQRDFFVALNLKRIQSSLGGQISRGWATDIHYLTGYFISRAKELNVPVPTLASVFRLVMAKREISQELARSTIPFEEQQSHLNDDNPTVSRTPLDDGKHDEGSRYINAGPSYQVYEVDEEHEGHDHEDQAY